MQALIDNEQQEEESPMTTTDRRACVNWHRLATDLEVKRAYHHLSVRAAAEQIGIPNSAVVKLRHGGKLSADSVARVVTWLYAHDIPAWITSGQQPADIPQAGIETEQAGQ